MIKEILLSLAVAAFSGVSSFVGSPKKANSGYEITAELHPNPYLGNITGYIYDNEQKSENVDLNSIGNMYFDDGFEFYVETKTIDEIDYTVYQLYVDTEILKVSYILSYSGWDSVTPATNFEGWTFSYKEDAREEEGKTLTFVLSDTQISYTLTKNYINCDIASSPVLPSTYTNETAPVKPSYYVLMVSSAGGYGFTSESVRQTGGIVIRNFNLFDQYNNSGYYASCSFNVDLPFNDCSITIEAFLPSYTITTNLERCTVSPAIPSSYIGTSFIGDYTFTAVSGYGFNKNYTHWEVTNLFIDRVEFSNLLWGSFYSSVKLRLRASGGNSSISVTAIEYDEENYKLGYDEGREDGWQAGYDRGHADGEIAGDSYGVWNWLKQAALTTGEFLSINLLPGFSIGSLLTALAGLMIIWLFIKGFLFKS